MLALFRGVVEDPISDKPLCEGAGGQAGLDCRDPASYVVGNEPRAHLFSPYLANLGGAYIGVGADQNYSQVAVARSEWAWFMDYDPKVVSVHELNEVVLRDAETPDAFVAAFGPDQRAATHAKVERAMAGDPDAAESLRTLRVWGDRLFEHYTAERAPPAPSIGLDGKQVPPGSPDFGWLRVPEHYAYVRTLFLQGRARAVKGDMLGTITMAELGRAAREMGVPVRVYYTSNAPYAWGGTMTAEYRANVRGLPMDHASLVVQTLGSRSGFGQQSYWHYDVMSGRLHQLRLGLPGFDHVSKLVYDRVHAGDPDLTTVGIPGG